MVLHRFIHIIFFTLVTTLLISMVSLKSFAAAPPNCAPSPSPRPQIGHLPVNRNPRPPTPLELKNQALQNFRKLIIKLQQDSGFRNVDGDISQLRNYGTQAGVERRLIDNAATFLHNRGIASSRREQATCGGSFDYSAKLGPVRNQDSVGWCFAFSAADYYSFKTGKRISAASIAVGYNSYWRWLNHLFEPYCGEERESGGNEDSAAGIAKASGGLCLESEFRSEDNGNARLYDTLANLERSKLRNDISRAVACSQEVFPHMTNPDILQVLRTSNQQELIKNFSDKACVHRVPVPNVNIIHYSPYIHSSKTYLDSIDNELTHGNIASMGYRPNILYNIDSPNVSDLHSSLVIGRKWDTRKGECVYLVRNSWGPGCKQYDQRLECHNGNVWMPRSVLTKGIYDVTIMH